MSVDVGDVVRVVGRMTDMYGSLIENVYFVKHTGTSTAGNIPFLSAAEVWLSTAYARVQASMPTTVTPVDVVCDKVSWVGGKLVTTENIGTIPWTTWSGGTATGEGLPQGNAAVVNFPGQSPGIQGRKYVGPLGEVAQANGVLTSAAQTQLTLFAGDVLSGFLVGVEQMTFVLMSSKYAQAVGVLSAVIKAVVGYQRRRKQGVGA